MWQRSLSDCSPHTHGNFTGCDWRPWLGAETTRGSKHGGEYLLSWKHFFRLFSIWWMWQDAALSSRSPATAADGWNSLFPPTRSRKKASVSVLLRVKNKTKQKPHQQQQTRTLPALPKQEFWCNICGEEQDQRSGWTLQLLGAHAKVSETPYCSWMNSWMMSIGFLQPVNTQHLIPEANRLIARRSWVRFPLGWMWI